MAMEGSLSFEGDSDIGREGGGDGAASHPFSNVTVVIIQR
jgi:hypothetical protein